MPLGSFGLPYCWRWWSVAQRRVRALRVVVDAPAFRQHPRLLQGIEDLSVQEFIAHFAVEAFTVAVLPGTARPVLNHPGITLNFVNGALARLGLARAYVLQGDSAKARTAYEDFLTLWKDADPDIPVLKQAKAEYAKLE